MEIAQSPRIAAVPPEAMSAQQQAAANALAAGPRGSVRGPFAVMLHSPGVFAPAQALGAYLRFESAIPAALRELAILVAARHWRQTYEWRVHAALAREAGVSDSVIAAIAAATRPPGMSPHEAIIYDFCSQVHTAGTVDDATYAPAEELLGQAGIIDLCAICGYYSMLAMMMNVARNPAPEVPTPFK